MHRTELTATYDPSVLFVTEARLVRTPDGSVYSPDGVNGDAQWDDYISVLRDIRLAARVQDQQFVSDVPSIRAVEVDPVPFYSGAVGFLRSLPRVVGQLYSAVGRSQVVVVRVPGLLGYTAAALSVVRCRPYVAELVGDPLDVINALHGESFVGRVAARGAAAALRLLARRAAAVRYVTESALQRKYPASPDAPTMALGNVILTDASYKEHHPVPEPSNPLKILVIGSQNTSYKGHDTALRVLRELLRTRRVTMTIIGGGTLHHEYVDEAKRLGIIKFVRFLGHVTDRAVIQQEMDDADIFLMPSRTEGLPRVINEAHARSLPVVGSNVGGIPELLDSRLTVSPDDVMGYAEVILALTGDRQWYSAESARGYRRTRPLHKVNRTARFKEWSETIRSVSRLEPSTAK
ncbi:glycosyltransferase family 4 protein [Citricoccus zhacaiensis]